MINPPEQFIRLCGIDPGISNLGISIIDLYSDDRLIVNYSETLVGDNLINPKQFICEVFGKRYAKIVAITNGISDILQIYYPNIVISEAPFYNPHCPEAYAALVEVINMTKHTVFNFNPSVYFETIDPSTIKKSMGVSGRSGDKDLMRMALLNKNIIYNNGINPAILSEHAIDSICVCIAKAVDINSH